MVVAGTTGVSKSVILKIGINTGTEEGGNQIRGTTRAPVATGAGKMMYTYSASISVPSTRYVYKYCILGQIVKKFKNQQIRHVKGVLKK